MSDRNKHVATRPQERQLRTIDLFLIWFGASIAITEIWAGGLPQLTSLGLWLGIVAIVLGRVIGNGLMGLMARIGSNTGLPTMVLTRPAFGVRGSALPALFNILQLLGWTGWMLFVGFLYLDQLAGYIGWPTAAENPVMKYLWVLLLGTLCTLWALGGQRFWQYVQRGAALLLFVLTLGMTWVVLSSTPAATLSPPAALTGGDLLRILPGADLVIAMSVSWLPLVADYSRYARKPRSGFRGTFWGYFIGGVWMYAVGLLVAISTSAEDPAAMVVEVMGKAGMDWAVFAIVLVLLSTITTTFLDIFSAVVSTQNLWPGLPDKVGNLAAGVLGTLIALFLDVFAYEPFLLAIGAIFLPAFTIVLADYYWIKSRRLQLSQVDVRGGAYWYTGGFNLRAVVAWLAGFLAYDWASGWSSIGFFYGKLAQLRGMEAALAAEPFSWGQSIPCIIVSALSYWLLTRVFGSGIGKKRKR